MILVAFDTETTGIEPGSRPVQLAGAAFDLAGTSLGEFTSLINPGMPCPPAAAAIHGRTDAELAEAPSMRDVMERFRDWVRRLEAEHGGPVHLVAHNLPYDASILLWAARFAGVDLGLDYALSMCTLAASRALRVTKAHNLPFLAGHYGLPPREAHEALADALTCRDLFLHFAGTYGMPAMAPLAEWTEWRYAEVPDDCELPYLPKAVAGGIAISFDYVDGKGLGTSRSVIPYGWAEKAGQLRFHGHCQLRGDTRTFLMMGVSARLARAG